MKEFVGFFRSSEKAANLMSMQGLRDSVMPVISSKGSFLMYKAAGAVSQSTSRKKSGLFIGTRGSAVIAPPGGKRVRFSEQQAPPS